MKARPASGFKRTAATIPGVGSEACRSATRTDSIEVNSTVASRPMRPESVPAARGAKLLAMVCSIGSWVRLIRCAEKSNGRTPSVAGFFEQRGHFFLGNGARAGRRIGCRHHCTTKLVNSRSSTSPPPCLLLHGANFGERLFAQLVLALARHEGLVVAIAHEEQQVVADQRHVLLHAVDRLLIVRHHFHADLQEPHHRAVLEINHHRRVERVIEGTLRAAFAALGRGARRGHHRGDETVLAHLEVGERMQLRVDKAADDDREQRHHENDDGIHEQAAA